MKKYASDNNDLLIKSLDTHKDEFSSSMLELGMQIKEAEKKAKELVVKAAKEAVNGADRQGCCYIGDRCILRSLSGR